jgi:tetratricopeptide (TPR) repeat protein
MTPSARLSRFWRRILAAGPGPEAAPGPPLFPPRPLPPKLPRGPGLPDWQDILSAAPPVADPNPIAPAVPAVPAAPPSGPPGWPDKRPPTETERQALAEVADLLAAGQIARAAACLDAALRDRPEASDARGRPIYILESLHIALLLGADDAAADRAARLRPHLAPDDAVIETLYARAAIAAGNRAAARANWRAAIARAPALAEARDWLAANLASPAGGILAHDLLGDQTLPGPLPAPALSAPPTEPVVLPDWLPARLLAGVTLSVDPDGTARATPTDGAAETAAVADTAAPAAAELALLFRHPQGLDRASAVAELVLAAFVVQRQFLGHLRPARLYVGAQAWALPPAAAKAPPAAQVEMLAALFPGLRVIGDHDARIREAVVLEVDGATRNAATGTLFGAMMPWVVQWAAEARARAHAACGLPDTALPPRAAGRRPRVLYLSAPPARTLAEPVRERLFDLFTAAGHEVAVVDTEAMAWRRQVQLAYGADIITGAHGPAFGLVLWAHPQTRVLEFFPEGIRRYDGQLFAEAAGIVYLGLEGVAERGFVIQARQRWGPPVGDGERPVGALPWSMLERALGVPAAGAATPVP